jgi:hypothetical protein
VLEQAGADVIQVKARQAAYRDGGMGRRPQVDDEEARWLDDD